MRPAGAKAAAPTMEARMTMARNICSSKDKQEDRYNVATKYGTKNEEVLTC